jgi:hypothetical protein
VHTHALAAQATQHATLQQGRPLPRRPRPPLAAEGTGVIGEPTLIELEAFPVDVALVHARHDGRLRTISAAFTDVAPLDEFRLVASGKAAFRTVDLVALCELVDWLCARKRADDA